MFGQVRTNRSTVLMAGTVIFLVAFVSLAYNHLDKWEPPADVATDTETSIIGDTHDEPKKTEPEQPEQHGAMSKPDHPSNASTELGDYYFNYIMKARVSPADKKYAPFGAFPMELPAEPKWTEMIGEDLCIIDLDNRPFDEPGQIFSPGLMSWDRADETHGLSLGVLNHWLYANCWFENRRARYKNKPARGPSDMHEVLRNIAAMKKPALPTDVFEDESRPQKYRDNRLPMFLKPRAAPRRPLVARVAPQLWPRSYSLSTPARTDALGPTAIPPSKTDPAQPPLEVTKHMVDDLVLEMSRLTLRQRIEPRPAKKGKKDPKLALITIEPAPTTPVTVDVPSSKPPRLYHRRRRALLKSKEAAAARQVSASSSTQSSRSASIGSRVSLGVPPVPSAVTAPSGTGIDLPSVDTSSIDFNMLIAQLAADAHAAQHTPSHLNLLPTPDDLSTFFGELGSVFDFGAPHQVTLESLAGSDPLFDQLFIDVPHADSLATVSPLENTPYDQAQEPFDLSTLLEFNAGLDITMFAPDPSAQATPVPSSATTTTPTLDVATDISLFAIEDPKEAAALQQVLQLLDDPTIMEELAEFTAEEQVEILTEFGMDLYKDKFRNKSHDKSKGKSSVERKSVVKPVVKSKGGPSAVPEGKPSAEAKDKAPTKVTTKAKRTKKATAAAQTSQDPSVNFLPPSDPNDFNVQTAFDPSLLQAPADVVYSQPAWPAPPAVSAVTPAFSVDPMFDPVQLVDMPFDPAQCDPALFAAMQFDPALLATASFDSTQLANFTSADTIQPATSMQFVTSMPQFEFTQYVPTMQTPAPFALVPQPAPLSPATIDSQPTFISDFTSLEAAPLLYQQAPLPYQQVPLPYQQALPYQQVPLQYQQAPLPYQQVPLSYEPTSLPYQPDLLSYQPDPLSYQSAPLLSYQQPALFDFNQQAYFNFDQQASFNFDYTAAVSAPAQPMPTFIPDLYNPFLTPDWFCAPMATMLQMPLTA